MTAITKDERHEEAGREDVIEALGHMCRAAKRLPHVVGTPELPSRWDQVHTQIDALLLELDVFGVSEEVRDEPC